MVIHVGSDLEAALREAATREGLPPESLALRILRERVLEPRPTTLPEGDWERLLREIATDCGTSPPDSALGSEALYE